MEKITSVAAPPEIKSYRKLCKKLKVGAAKVRRPNLIDMLISMRQNFLHPKPVKQVDGITRIHVCVCVISVKWKFNKL